MHSGLQMQFRTRMELLTQQGARQAFSRDGGQQNAVSEVPRRQPQPRALLPDLLVINDPIPPVCDSW